MGLWHDMGRIEKIIANTVFFLLCLITILIVFEDKVQIPFWLQPIGRMHPLVLHFPIGFIVLLVMVNLFRGQLQEESFQVVNKFLLLLTAFTTVLTALMGIFLSHEEGYTSNLLSIHKWIGIAVAYLMYVLILVYRQEKIYKGLLFTSFFCIVFAGHFGAGLTHGVNFLTEPIFHDEETELDLKAPLFTSIIQPIFRDKCQNCHNADKHKGDLDLTTIEKIHAGGKNGPIWMEGIPDSSHLLQRAMLPLEEKKHMPPKGKPQLSELELEFLKQWITHGANEHIALLELSETDTLKLLAQEIIDASQAPSAPVYTFDFADQKLISALNNPYRTVVQKSPHSPAIDVVIYGKEAFQKEFLTDLLKIKDQLVSLNLSYMPVSDEIFDIVSKFKNLEVLNLNFTDITGKNITQLNQCKHLHSLSVSGTEIKTEALSQLQVPLSELFVWNTPIALEDADQLSKSLAIAQVEIGFRPDPDEILTLPSPILQNGKNIITNEEDIVLANKINGVKIYYTDDGTDPDSTSMIYSHPLRYDYNTTLKAYAYQEGWLPSDTITFELLQKGVKPNSVTLLTAQENKDAGGHISALTDDEQGRSNEIPFLSWLGFYSSPFVVLADLGEDAPAIEQVAISYGTLDNKFRAWVPASVEVWGGNEKDQLQLLKKGNPESSKEVQNRKAYIFPLAINKSQFRYYQLVAYPFKKLPEFHRQKGEQAGVFIDQIFFYEKDPTQPHAPILAKKTVARD